MSALAMLLTAAMVVPGNGPKMESGEMIEHRPLDLSGEWEGILTDEHGRELRGKLNTIGFNTEPVFFAWGGIKDEGNGRFRFSFLFESEGPGIYRQDGDSLILSWYCPPRQCKGCDSKMRPTKFKGGDGQRLLILHRVKPRK